MLLRFASCEGRSRRAGREVILLGLNGKMANTLALILLAATAGSLTGGQREVVKRVDKRLLAPCCYAQSVGEHLSAEAAQMRAEIELMAASGLSESAIIEHYKAQYGERILVVPDGNTGNFLFNLPWAAFIVCLAIFMAAIWRMARAGAHSRLRANQEDVDRWCGEYGEAVERELRDWT